MTNERLGIATGGSNPPPEFITKHHLRQFALGIRIPAGVVFFEVKIFELDSSQPHPVAHTADHHDTTLRLVDPFEQQAAQQKMTQMVHTELAFETIDGQVKSWDLCDGRVADQCVDLRYVLQDLSGGLSYRCKLGQVHPDGTDVGVAPEFLLEPRDDLGRLFRVSIEHRDRRAFGKENPCRFKSGAAGGAGDQIGSPHERVDPVGGPTRCSE